VANNVDPFVPEYWSRRTQARLRKMLVGMKIASFEERATLRDGDTVHRPFKSDFHVDDYTKGTDVSIQDITATDETLIVNKSKIIGFYVDEVDEIQSKYRVANEWIDRTAYRLKDQIDGELMQEVVNANLTVDDGSIGGTAGNPITLTTTNAANTFATAYATLAGNDVEQDKQWYVIVDPFFASVMNQTLVKDGFNLADSALRNSFVGNFQGFKVFMSNNLRSSQVLTMGTIPTATDTVTVKGVVFTYVAAPAVAGDVDIGASADISRTNLEAAINGGAGAGSLYIEVSQADRNTLSGNRVVAVDDSVLNTLTITGSGRIITSETLTDGSDEFGDQTVSAMAGRMGNIDLVMQKEVRTDRKAEPKRIGFNFLTHTLYGIKTFDEGTERLLDLQLKV